MTDTTEYTPPKVWKWEMESGGQFANINRPIAGPTHEKELPVGKHPLQLYSLATPNGVKVTVMLEELLATGHEGAEYDAWLIRIGDGEQFSSGYVAVNPNSKIPVMVDHSVDPPRRIDAVIDHDRDFRVRVHGHIPAAELLAVADADQPGVVLRPLVARRQQLLQHHRHLHAVRRGQRVKLERVFADGQLLLVGGAGDRAVDVRELPPALHFPFPDFRRGVLGGIGHWRSHSQ